MSGSSMFAVAAEPPKKLKPQEVYRYNPTWIDFSVEKFPFKPIPNDQTFRYLWIIKPPERLILGIEFDDVDTVRRVLTHYGFGAWLQTQDDNDLKNLLSMGHPTLSAHFNFETATVKSGDITAYKPDKTYGSAFYGGELNFTDGEWTINNSSGRHSGGKMDYMTGNPLDARQWMRLLLDAKMLFLRQMNLDVKIAIPKIK